MNEVFETWTYKDQRYIAIPIDRGNVHIISQRGDNYGAYMSVESFRKKQKEGTAEDWAPLGRSILAVRPERDHGPG